MGARILVVEDDADINEIIAVHLTRQGHDCTQAYSGSEGMMRLEAGGIHSNTQGTTGAEGSPGVPVTGQAPRRALPFDLLICDLMLPGATGEELIAALRAQDVRIPIIVISARTSTTDRVDLLKLGADDYLTKPFDLDELAARVEVQLRHRAPVPAPGLGQATTMAEPPSDTASAMRHAVPDALRFRTWELDPAARTFAVDGIGVALTRIEFNLLETLMRQPKRAFSKQDLFEAAWGEPYAGDDSTVTVHISNIRAKLKVSGTDGYIKTVWGIGFKLTEE